jgi:hypothetical protein
MAGMTFPEYTFEVGELVYDLDGNIFTIAELPKDSNIAIYYNYKDLLMSDPDKSVSFLDRMCHVSQKTKIALQTLITKPQDQIKGVNIWDLRISYAKLCMLLTSIDSDDFALVRIVSNQISQRSKYLQFIINGEEKPGI